MLHSYFTSSEYLEQFEENNPFEASCSFDGSDLTDPDFLEILRSLDEYSCSDTTESSQETNSLDTLTADNCSLLELLSSLEMPNSYKIPNEYEVSSTVDEAGASTGAPSTSEAAGTLEILSIPEMNRLIEIEEHNSKFANIEYLRQLTDYHEGRMATESNIIYLGSIHKSNRKTKQHLREEQTLEYYKARFEQYKGCVLYPEYRRETWNYQINQAFMLGGIEAGKTFILITPKSEYARDYITGTIDELLWLKDNGYEFTDGMNDTLICTPPRTPISEPIIKNYFGGNTQYYTKDEMNRAKQEIFRFPPRSYRLPHRDLDSNRHLTYRDRVPSLLSRASSYPSRSRDDYTQSTSRKRPAEELRDQISARPANRKSGMKRREEYNKKRVRIG